MRDFKKIIAWQKAHALGVRLDEYVDPKRFRRRPELRSQLLRAIDSVSATIAEGAGKATPADFVRYLDMAQGSVREVHNHLLKARDTGCLNIDAANLLIADLDEVGRVLYAYARAVRSGIGGMG